MPWGRFKISKEGLEHKILENSLYKTIISVPKTLVAQMVLKEYFNPIPTTMHMYDKIILNNWFKRG